MSRPAISPILAQGGIETVLARLLHRIENQARLMGAMMARLGVDPVDASQVRGGTALAAAWRRCLGCRRGTDCGAWLKTPAPANQQAPPFCPNADFLAESSVRPASWPAPSSLSAVSDKSHSGDRPT
jgi:Family of unknown function (DUF6455)